MHRRLKPVAAIAILTVLTIVAVVRPIVADDPRDTVTADAVRKLVQELGASNRAGRTTAEKRLLEIGPAVLPHLPPPELLTTVSVRESVDRIRHELERRQASESVRPSVVSLEGTRPLGDWIAEISRLTQNRLDATDLPESRLSRKLTMKIKDQPFWPALDEILKQNALAFEAESTHRGLRLVNEDESRPRPLGTVGYAGPFRLWVPPAELIAVGKPPVDQPQKRLMRLLLHAQPEPRLRPLFLQFASVDMIAESEGRALRSFSPDARYELVVNEPGGRSRMQLDFVVPEGPAPKQIDLHGTFRMTTAAGTAAVRFDGISEKADGKLLGIERRRGGVTVSLERIHRERKPGATSDLRIAIRVAYDRGGPAFESHRTWILHNEVSLEAGDTRVPLNGGFETTLQDDGAVGMEYRFVNLPDPLPDYAFVYVAPTLIVDVPVRFALESVAVRVPE